jgi:hypothetical protein
MSDDVTSGDGEGGGSDPKGKRKKIDLKSRLSSVRATGAMPATPGGERKSDPLSFPPPLAGGASVPPPRLPGGIVAPRISSPFAPPEPEVKQTAQAQTIKVEIGEEVHAERKKTSKRTALLAFIFSVIAGALGFFVGTTFQKGQDGRQAIKGATALGGELEAANKKMLEFADGLSKAVEAIGNDEVPEGLEELLKTTSVPFSSANFQGKSVGGLPAELQMALFQYAVGVEKLNDRKDTLRNIYGQVKPMIEKQIAEKKKATVPFTVVLAKMGSDQKLVARVLGVKEPFEEDGKWPEKFTSLEPTDQPGKFKDSEVVRWDGKDKLPDQGTMAIPLDRASSARLGNAAEIVRFKLRVVEVREIIDGSEGPTPDMQKEGLRKLGERISQELKKIASR